MRLYLRDSALVLATITACAVPTSESDDAIARQTPNTHVTHRMPTGSTSVASVQTLANATCTLHEAGNPMRTMRVFSDDRGTARIQLDHLAHEIRHGELDLDCTDESGAGQTDAIDVVIDDTASPSAPAPYDTRGLPTLARLDVPASSLTAADLATRHYPPRPNANDADGTAAWTRLVTSGAAIVTPHVIADTVRHGNANSGNWSGYTLTSSAQTPIYAWIYGEWNVPRGYSESGFYSSDHSSFWVGIDGWGTNDVVQDGTDSNTLTVFWVQTSSYDAWLEWYPQSSQVVSNFPVNPGDRIHAWTWMTDANGNYSSQPTVGWFYMWNENANVYVYYSLHTPSGATFSGHSAEWVLERPTVNGSVARLTNYSTAQMTNALTYDLNGGSHTFTGDNTDVSWNVTMTGSSGNALSTVAPVNSSTMAWTWHAYQ